MAEAAEEGKSAGEAQSGDVETEVDVRDDGEDFIEPAVVPDDLTIGPAGSIALTAPMATAPIAAPVAAAPPLPAPAPAASALPAFVAATPPAPAPAAVAPPLPATDARGFYDSNQVKAHLQWHNFHHRGHGNWLYGLPPQGADPRTGVKGPGKLSSFDYESTSYTNSVRRCSAVEAGQPSRQTLRRHFTHSEPFGRSWRVSAVSTAKHTRRPST